MSQPATVRIEYVPVNIRISKHARDLADCGNSLENIARVADTGWTDVREALAQATHDALPEIVPPKRQFDRDRHRFKYVRYAVEVARLRDEQGMAFPAIANALGIHLSTATRAYDHSHRAALETAGADGKTPKRGHLKTPLRAKRDAIAALLSEGKSNREIAMTVGCGTTSVQLVRAEIQQRPNPKMAS
jgi:hypothetical protein